MFRCCRLIRESARLEVYVKSTRARRELKLQIEKLHDIVHVILLITLRLENETNMDWKRGYILLTETQSVADGR